MQCWFYITQIVQNIIMLFCPIVRNNKWTLEKQLFYSKSFTLTNFSAKSKKISQEKQIVCIN